MEQAFGEFPRVGYHNIKPKRMLLFPQNCKVILRGKIKKQDSEIKTESFIIWGIGEIGKAPFKKKL